MSVIRTLHETDTGQEREEEKKKLEQQFKKCDKRLDELVGRHQSDLSNVMSTYSTLSGRLQRARTRLASVRESLIACKELLHYKRDELKKLWLDGVEQKHVLQLLHQIEAMKQLPEQISGQLAKKDFLAATKGLTNSLHLLQGTLSDVEALGEVRVELESCRSRLYTQLLEDLTGQLYFESTWGVLQLQRTGSTRNNPFQRAGSGRGSSDKKAFTPGSGKKARDSGRDSGRRPGEHLKARRLLLEPGANTGSLLTPGEDEWNLILEDPERADPTHGLAHAILIDMECLAMLNKLPDAVESLSSELQSQLLQILSKTTQQLLDASRYPADDSRLLPQLFSAVVTQLQRAAPVPAISTSSRAAPSTQHMPQQTNNSFSEPTADINSYFVRRKQARPKRSSLFRFDSSSTALSMNDYMTERTAEDGDNTAKEEKVF